MGDEQERMKSEIQRMAKESLGVEIRFEGDAALSRYRRGRLLKFGELREGMVVWGWYHEDGEDEPRVDSAFRLEGGADGSFILDDGSSFSMDISVGDPEAEVVEVCLGRGTKRIYEAIPL